MTEPTSTMKGRTWLFIYLLLLEAYPLNNHYISHDQFCMQIENARCEEGHTRLFTGALTCGFLHHRRSARFDSGGWNPVMFSLSARRRTKGSEMQTVTTQEEFNEAIGNGATGVVVKGGAFRVRGTTTVHAGLGSKVFTDPGSEVYADLGSEVHAGPGSEVYAGPGSVVYADSGSEVHAGSGSEVYAGPGSVVYVYSGSEVYAYSGSELHAGPDSVVYADPVFGFGGARWSGFGGVC